MVSWAFVLVLVFAMYRVRARQQIVEATLRGAILRDTAYRGAGRLVRVVPGATGLTLGRVPLGTGQHGFGVMRLVAMEFELRGEGFAMLVDAGAKLRVISHAATVDGGVASVPVGTKLVLLVPLVDGLSKDEPITLVDPRIDLLRHLREVRRVSLVRMGLVGASALAIATFAPSMVILVALAVVAIDLTRSGAMMWTLGNFVTVKFLKILAGLVVAWLVVLVVIGLVYGGSIEKRVIARVGEPLQAKVTIEKTQLALIRGFLELEKLAVKREDAGFLSIDIAEVRCDLPAFGLALFDDDCKTLSFKTMRVKISALGVFKARNARTPVRAKRVVIDDAILELSPSALASGIGKVTITVEHAEANHTMFKTPLSWIFALDVLKAKVELPGDVIVQLGYKNGKLTVAGGLFGSEPIEMPFAIPVADLKDDPEGELKKLVGLGRDIAEKAVMQRGKDWLKKLTP